MFFKISAINMHVSTPADRIENAESHSRNRYA